MDTTRRKRSQRRSSMKRAWPFDGDRDSTLGQLAPEPKLQSAAQGTLNGARQADLSASERAVLEQAAKILGTPLSELIATRTSGTQQSGVGAAPSGYHAQHATFPDPSLVRGLSPQSRLSRMSPATLHSDGLPQNGRFIDQSWSTGSLVPLNGTQLPLFDPLGCPAPLESDWDFLDQQAGQEPFQFDVDSDHASSSSEPEQIFSDEVGLQQPWENVQIPSVKESKNPGSYRTAQVMWLPKGAENPPVSPFIAQAIPSRPSRPASKTSCADGYPDDQLFLVKKARGPFQSSELRTETSETRKRKACVRCRMQRIRCIVDETDPEGDCLTCQNAKMRIYTLPCARYKITECELYRVGKAPGMEFTLRWPKSKLSDITQWADPNIRDIEVLSDVSPKPLKFQVRRFVPLQGDTLKRGWMDGKVKKFKETTPFAIANMATASKMMKAYINDYVMDCIEFFIKGCDKLIIETYEFAIAHMRRHRDDEQGLLMGNYLRLWFAIRRTATVEHIIGEETLDMEPETVDRSFPLYGKVALPPVMIQQLDMILTIGVLRPLVKKVLDDLQKLIMSNKSDTWMTVYLITFMSLHDCSALTAENYWAARKHGLNRRFVMPSFVSERHHAANVFLSHYHYRTQPCNPFKLNWKRRQVGPFSDFSTLDIKFIERTKTLVEKKKNEFAVVKENCLYEDDWFFISQMYEDDWSPSETVIDYDDGTINNVPLREWI